MVKFINRQSGFFIHVLIFLTSLGNKPTGFMPMRPFVVGCCMFKQPTFSHDGNDTRLYKDFIDRNNSKYYDEQTMILYDNGLLYFEILFRHAQS